MRGGDEASGHGNTRRRTRLENRLPWAVTTMVCIQALRYLGYFGSLDWRDEGWGLDHLMGSDLEVLLSEGLWLDLVLWETD